MLSNNSAPVPAKSIFQSKTFWGAILTLIASISPAIGKNIADYQATGKINPNDISQIVVIVATTGLTILGRMDANAPVYTPNGFPGPDKPKTE
jgi:hypothetical protein